MWRAALLAFVLGLISHPWLPAAAQEGTIRIVLGFPAGASSDLLTRLLADLMRAALGQPRELASLMKRDYDRWGPIIKASGFKPEN